MENLINDIQNFLLKRGWKLKIAKKDPVEQSLFIHAINELGSIQNYLLVDSHPFNKDEIVKLYISSVTHDCEKETTEWQEKIYLGEKPPHHTNPEYAKKFVSEIVKFLNSQGQPIQFDQRDINDIVSSQALHMKASAQKPSNVFGEITREHKSERWSEIAHLIDLFDDIVSIGSVESSIDLLRRDEYRMVNERLEFTYHKVGNVRGILTSLLHKACGKAYESHGFTPFLYYANGTLYFRVKKNGCDKEHLAIDEIKDALIKVIGEFIYNIEIDNKVVIENPQTRLFRGKEFFDKELIDKYFFSLQRKYRPKVDGTGLKKLILSKFDSLENAREQLNIQKVEDSGIINSIMQNISTYSEKFPKFTYEFLEIHNTGISKPQQYIFQLFKEIIEGIDISKNTDLEKEYDSFFGNGKYSRLKSLTNDPKKNFKLFIEPFWEKEIDFNNNKLKIKMLSSKRQQEILSKVLCNILKNNISKCPRLPKDDFSADIANLLISDLSYPCNVNTKNINDYAEQQLNIIGKSKAKLFNKTKGERLCPICYKIMPEANPVAAAFLSAENGVAKVFNNHAIASSSFGGSVNICKLCYDELLLRHAVLGRTPSDLIVLFPPLNFAKIQGSKIIETMKDIQNKLGQFFSYHNPNLNVRVQVNNLRNITTQILGKSAENISAELNPDKFIESFMIEISDETRKNDIKKLEDKINELWDSIENFNGEFGTKYTTSKEIAEDVFENKCIHDKDAHEYKNIPEIERNSIIEESRVNAIQYSMIYETPNIIVISLPMTFSYNEEDAEVNILLKRLLFASYLYLLTDCAVMVIPGKEIIHIPQIRNMVYVQPNATLKQIIKEDWISLFDLNKWMVAISASVKLASEGAYSSRSGIFEVLTQPTVGYILSRITSQKMLSGAPKRADYRLINILDQLQNTGVLKNETIVNTKVRAI